MLHSILLTLLVLTFVWISACRWLTRITCLPSLPALPANVRIVVVGNGPTVVQGPPKGHLIDAADVVVRFNAAKRAPAAYTGTRTDVHVVTAGSWQPHVPGAQRVIVYNTPFHKWVRMWPCLRCLALDASEVPEVAHPTSGLVFIHYLVRTYPHNPIALIGFDGFRSNSFDENHYYRRTDRQHTLGDRAFAGVAMHLHTNERARFVELVRSHGNVGWL